VVKVEIDDEDLAHAVRRLQVTGRDGYVLKMQNPMACDLSA
jgi:Arc/MetJ family transcription regulator